MTSYIVTFYSHFEAISLKRDFEKMGISVLLCPVPRQLSSSCGTCAQFDFQGDPSAHIQCEYEKLLKKDENQYTLLVCNN